MPPHPPTLGLVLAGGIGRRLGGVDKLLLDVGGATILSRTLARLRPDCVALAISANGDPSRFGSEEAEVLADGDGGGNGPLAGILAGLDHAARSRPALPWVATVPGDAPFLPEELVGRLHASRGDAPAVIARSRGRTHPVIGLWSVDLRGRLRHLLRSGERRVGVWAARAGAIVADWPDAAGDPFFNVNEPADLAAARAQAAATGF